MRINVFTPLPDARTEIANVSHAMLSELSQMADVHAWTDQQQWRQASRSGYAVHRFDPFTIDWRELNRADITFFNIGNNARFHRAIFDVARRMPGIMILHDTVLAHFVNAYASGSGEDLDFYLREMAVAGLGNEAQAFINGNLAFESFAERQAMTPAVARTGLAVIVHNEAEREKLTRTLDVPVFYLPLCLTAQVPPSRTDARRTRSDGRIRLIVFGFLGTNRCLSSILEALAGMASRNRFHLDIFGELDQPSRYETLLAQLTAESVVTLHGYVPEDELDQAIASADLAINLRNPTMGEASASQLRIWASTLPSIVSDTGWYATLPSDAVMKVRVGHEVQDLREHLDAFAQAPDRFAQLGVRGRQIVLDQHLPASYASGLMAIAHASPSLYAHHAALRLARRTSELAVDAFGETAARAFVPGAAAAIVDVFGERDPLP